MKRKIIAGMILFVMCISMCMTCFAASFTDLLEDHWAYENITKLVDEGVINGYPDGTYRPENTVSKAEFLKLVITSLYPSNSNYYETSSYRSVHWGFPYLLRAYQDGYINDHYITEANELDLPINRLDMACILAKVCEVNKIGKVSSKTSKTSFTDTKSLSKDEIKSINTVEGSKLINGYPDKTFGPERTMTRAECATVIFRLKYLINEEMK